MQFLHLLTRLTLVLVLCDISMPAAWRIRIALFASGVTATEWLRFISACLLAFDAKIVKERCPRAYP